MTTGPIGFMQTAALNPILQKSRTSFDTSALHLATEAERGTDGLTIAERTAYAQQAKSIHNILSPEELEKAFNRLFQ